MEYINNPTSFNKAEDGSFLLPIPVSTIIDALNHRECKSESKIVPIPESIVKELMNRKQDYNEIETIKNKNQDYLISQNAKQSSEEDSKEYIVEKIIDKCHDDDGKVYYSIQWKGYDEKYNSWEPLENVKNCMDLVEEFEKIKEAHETSNYSPSFINKPGKKKILKEKFICHTCNLVFGKSKELQEHDYIQHFLKARKFKNAFKDNCRHCIWIRSHDLKKKQNTCPFCERQL